MGTITNRQLLASLLAQAVETAEIRLQSGLKVVGGAAALELIWWAGAERKRLGGH